jgi:hypothetical protein
VITAGFLYGGAVAWFARAERREDDRAIRLVPDLALASFAVESAVPGWPGESAGVASKLGERDRLVLEEGLRSLKGKAVRTDPPPPEAWKLFKDAPVRGVESVPARTRVIDERDVPTCLALRAHFGADHFLKIVAGYEIAGGSSEPVARCRVLAVVFDTQGKTLWTNVYEESQSLPPGAERDGRALETSLAHASRRAIDQVVQALRAP